MRQWMLDPKYMCNRHLGAEHRESHMMSGALLKGRTGTLNGLAKHGRIEVHNIPSRHAEVEAALRLRGFRLVAPWPNVDDLLWVAGTVSRDMSLVTLYCRCLACRELIPRKLAREAAHRLSPAEVVDYRRIMANRQLEGL